MELFAVYLDFSVTGADDKYFIFELPFPFYDLTLFKSVGDQIMLTYPHYFYVFTLCSLFYQTILQTQILWPLHQFFSRKKLGSSSSQSLKITFEIFQQTPSFQSDYLFTFSPTSHLSSLILIIAKITRLS